jgi:hypothetical protein
MNISRILRPDLRQGPMAEDLIRYDILAQEALRGVVRKVLSEVVKTGLPGEHHFFHFLCHPGAGRPHQPAAARAVRQGNDDRPPEPVLGLKVTETGFEVGLSFDGQREMLGIPYSAIKGFFDPSVQFGLQFDVERAGGAGTAEGADETPAPAPQNGATVTAGATAEKVVSLDSFRKKP